MKYVMFYDDDNGNVVEKVPVIFDSVRGALAKGIYRIKIGSGLNLYVKEMRGKNPRALFVSHKKVEKMLANTNAVVDTLNALCQKHSL